MLKNGPTDTPDRATNLTRRFAKTVEMHFDRKSFVLNWPNQGEVGANWGDKLNPYMANALSDRPFVHAREVVRRLSPPVHYWIGSHLSAACAHKNSVVWGAGFISKDAPIKRAPGKIQAVRGWKSVARLREAGIPCPDTVGDAALLLPRIYTPRPNARKHALGLIPHYLERDDPFFVAAKKWEDTVVIDITGGIEEVVDKIVSCDRIASSSLHGLICADAYGVPSLWLSSSGKLLGDGFKFHDYLSSVGREQNGPLQVDTNIPRAMIEDSFGDPGIDIDLDALWAACPIN
tara:strand:- start:4649 stop:5518 length:870 start_codon:yes stop_codon:yes gene_type:complete